ncbi:MAG: glycosyltransferase [Inhella sp.]|uniref:glycosyltransferase n=1 Tax=Inhella sp. TaxID=1921806 RepID=UPI00391F21E9
MKIGLQTWGSHGDIRPFVALANGLHAAGHEVTLVVTCVDSDRYAALQASLPYALEVVASPVEPDRAALERWGAALVAERDTSKQMRWVIERLLLPVEAEMYQASERLCANNDLVIGHYILHTVAIAAEKQGRPCVSVALAHGAVPSAFQPPLGVPNWGAFSNRLAWRLARWVLNRDFKRYADRLRAQQGLPPARDVIDTVWASPDLTLLACSPVLCTPRPDWPAHVRICGALDTPDSVAEGSVPEPLQDFLSAGAPPVYLTLGSMMSGSQEAQTLALLAEASRAASVRAIVQAPSGVPSGCANDGQLHFVSAAPHASVFPRCAAVLHHGGAGTSQAALRAGVPSVVLAYTAEQELWGRELQRLGVAGPPIARRSATVAKLAAALRQVTQSEPMRHNAQALGARLAGEDGVASAVGLIEETFAHRLARPVVGA